MVELGIINYRLISARGREAAAITRALERIGALEAVIEPPAGFVSRRCRGGT
jgi:hypothetical protein